MRASVYLKYSQRVDAGRKVATIERCMMLLMGIGLHVGFVAHIYHSPGHCDVEIENNNIIIRSKWVKINTYNISTRILIYRKHIRICHVKIENEYDCITRRFAPLIRMLKPTAKRYLGMT